MELQKGEKIRKAQKEHNCDLCCNKIQKGIMYVDASFRAKRCDDKDNQIGIDYIKYKAHLNRSDCKCKGGCKNVSHYAGGTTPNGDTHEDFSICDDCGIEK